ncbi:MAG TPA: ABC transporter permease [Candidatus Acidoferrales bacterium]
MDTLFQNIRYAVRMMGKSPGFTAVAVITLALGIGLNTALFSVVNAVLFKPLPAERPDELATVWNTSPNEFVSHQPMAYPDYADLRDASQSFSAISAYAMVPLALESDGESHMVIGQVATGNFFQMLGVRTALGRTFLPEEDVTRGTHPVVVLSHAAWQRRFGGSPGVLNSTIRLNGNAFTVVGVAEPKFTGLIRGFTPEVWLPMALMSTLRSTVGINIEEGETPPSTPAPDDRLDNRRARWLWVMGRLKPGVTVAQADAEMRTLGERLKEQYPDSNRDRPVSVLPASDVKFLPGIDTVLYGASFVLLGVVGLVLLIASANVANMLLARATSRRREVAVRLAMGASRGRLVGQLLTESALLAVAGGGVGLLLALWSNAALNGVELPLPVQLNLGLALDLRVLFYTLGVALLTTLAFGLVPALQASRADLVGALKEDTSGSGGSRGKRRLSNALVVVQVALSLVLLIGAGLSVRSSLNAQRIDPGFDADGVITASLWLDLAGYDVPRAEEFYRRLTERLGALPGVESVATASQVPLSFEISIEGVAAEGAEPAERRDWPQVDAAEVDSAYFQTMRIPILRGRAFNERDTREAARVVVINETFATRFWPGQDPLGKRVRYEGEQILREVVGVARDGKYRTLGEESRPFIYQPVTQVDARSRTVLVRVAGDPGPVMAALRNEVRQLDETIPVTGLQPLVETISATLLLPRIGASLFGLFGVLGLVLASVGLYGVIAFTVSQRTHEIGIRMALGAQRGDILRLVIRQGLVLTLIGLVIGVAASLGATQAIAVILYGISPTDVWTFGGVSLLLVAVAVLACWIPARRAARTDPMVALRYE